jgi:hypothetical protein
MRTVCGFPHVSHFNAYRTIIDNSADQREAVG